MNYKFIWFDLGLTLIEPALQAQYQRVLSGMGIAKDSYEVSLAFYRANKTFMRHYPHVLERPAEFYMPWYLGVVNYHLDVQAPLDAVGSALAKQKEQESARWKRMEGARETLSLLRSIGYRTGLISNWDATCRKVLKETQLDTLLDTVIVSCEVGAGKPEPEIFRIALERAGARPEECLHIGDNYYDDVKGAKAAGMDSLLLSPFGSLGLEEIEATSVISSIKEVPRHLGHKLF